MSTEQLTLKTKLAFGIGATGEGVTNWVFAGLTFFFYNQVLGLSGSLTGLAVLIAIIFDAISDPVMGSISDRYVSKLGRRHPFMFAAPFQQLLQYISCSFLQMDCLNMVYLGGLFFLPLF